MAGLTNTVVACQIVEQGANDRVWQKIAADAYNNCIHFNAIHVEDGSAPETGDCAILVQNPTQDYTNTTCGWYSQLDANADYVGDAILQMLDAPGSCGGQ